MGYVDVQTIHNPAVGNIPPSAWGDQVRDNQEFFAEPPACSVFHSTTQSPTSGTEQTLAANSERYDNDTMHSTSSNTERITINTPGKYEFFARVGFAANATGYRRVNYRLNGGAAVTLDTREPVSTGGPLPTILSVTWGLTLVQGDFVVVTAAQLSGGSLAIELREFSARWVSR